MRPRKTDLKSKNCCLVVDDLEDWVYLIGIIKWGQEETENLTGSQSRGKF